MRQESEIIVHLQDIKSSEQSVCLPIDQSTTAADVVKALVTRARLLNPTNYELAEIFVSGGQLCKERRLEMNEFPLIVQGLWPQGGALAPDATYRFYLLRKDGSGGFLRTISWTFCHSQSLNVTPDSYLIKFLEQKRAGSNDYADLCSLPDLNENTLLLNLKLRFNQSNIYTYVGTILIAINPFKFFPIYNPKYVAMYQGQKMQDLPPHIFAIADAAFTSMIDTKGDQCIVISGESGSGKTENTNFLLHHVTHRASHAGNMRGHGVEQIVNGAGPILEAFGNAKTVHNDNSSRFGKFIQVDFRMNGSVHGATVEKYLLEKSRIVSQAARERNYHVFYYLLMGAPPELSQDLFLLDAADYCYLNQSGCYTLEGVNESYEFERLKQSMSVVGFKPELQKRIFAVISAILLLGNVEFTKMEDAVEKSSFHHDDSVQVKNIELVSKISTLLDVREESFLEALTSKKTVAGGETMVVRYRLEDAISARNAMAKCLYGAVFDWIVWQINHALFLKQDHKGQKSNSIGVLDIFGFEDHDQNSFEQFCINYANEHLQFYFNQHIFKLEQEEYSREQIDWQNISFIDNTACLDLFAKRPNGLFFLLDEEGNFPGATNETLLEKFHHAHRSSAYYGMPMRKESSFSINHYAGRVKYHIREFREKNSDLIHADLVSVLKNSNTGFIRELVGSDPVAMLRWAYVRLCFQCVRAFDQAGKAYRARGGGKLGTVRRRASLTPKSLQSFARPELGSTAGSDEEGIETAGIDDADLGESFIHVTGKRNRNKKPHKTRSKMKDYQQFKTHQEVKTRETSKAKTPSVSLQFQKSLHSLLETLDKSNPYFVRCIKSNPEKAESSFNEKFILRQLQYTGMLATVKLRQSGYNYRVPIKDFISTYKALLPNGKASSKEDIELFLHSMDNNPGLNSFQMGRNKSFQLGLTQVFLRETVKMLLDDALHHVLVRRIVQIQSWLRMQSERHKYIQMRQTALLLQRCWRGALARENRRVLIKIRNKEVKREAADLQQKKQSAAILLLRWYRDCKRVKEDKLKLQRLKADAKKARSRPPILYPKPRTPVATPTSPSASSLPSDLYHPVLSPMPSASVPAESKTFTHSPTSPIQENVAFNKDSELDVPRTDIDELASSLEAEDSAQYQNRVSNDFIAEIVPCETGGKQLPSRKNAQITPPDLALMTGNGSSLEPLSKSNEVSPTGEPEMPESEKILMRDPVESPSKPTARPPVQRRTSIERRQVIKSRSIIDENQLLQTDEQTAERAALETPSIIKPSAPEKDLLKSPTLKIPIYQTSTPNLPTENDTVQTETRTPDSITGAPDSSQINEQSSKAADRSSSSSQESNTAILRERTGDNSRFGPPISRLSGKTKSMFYTPDSTENQANKVKATEKQPLVSLEAPVNSVVMRRNSNSKTTDDLGDQRVETRGLGPRSSSADMDEESIKASFNRAHILRQNVRKSQSADCLAMGVSIDGKIHLTKSPLSARKKNSHSHERLVGKASTASNSESPLATSNEPWTSMVPPNTPTMKIDTQLPPQPISHNRLHSDDMPIESLPKDHSERLDQLDSDSDSESDFVKIFARPRSKDDSEVVSPRNNQAEASMSMPMDIPLHRGNQKKSSIIKRSHASSSGSEAKSGHGHGWNLSSTSEWKYPDEFEISDKEDLSSLSKHIYDKYLDFRGMIGDHRTPSVLERVFRDALKEINTMLRTKMSVVMEHQSSWTPLKYTSIMELFVGFVKNCVQKELSEEEASQFPFPLAINAFRGYLDEFRKIPSLRPRKRKKEKKPPRKAKTRDFFKILGHILIPTQFNIPTFCEVCGKMMLWNISPGMECEACKFSCHKKCADKCETKCQQHPTQDSSSTAIFGVALERLCGDDNSIPPVVDKLIETLDSKIMTEGIYRKSGAASRVRGLRAALDEDWKAVNFSDYAVHVLTLTLKNFFRELPEPVFTFELYDEFIRCCDIPNQDEAITAMRATVDKLPAPNLKLISRLMLHLSRIAQKEPFNRMSPNALAVVFAPGLLRCKKTLTAQDSLAQVDRQCRAVEMMLNATLKKLNNTFQQLDNIDNEEYHEQQRLQEIRQSMRKSTPKASRRMKLPLNENVPELESPSPDDPMVDDAKKQERLTLNKIRSLHDKKEELTKGIPVLNLGGSDGTDDVMSTDDRESSAESLDDMDE